MTANTGLGCLKGFEWNSTDQTCHSTCEMGDIPQQNVGHSPFESDEDACQKFCKTLSGAKFALYVPDDKICFCKSGDTDRFENPCCLICPL